jgi:hypothetical protein
VLLLWWEPAGLSVCHALWANLLPLLLLMSALPLLLLPSCLPALLLPAAEAGGVCHL